MKTFKEFINENIKDLLKGKSDEDIEKELKNLSFMGKIIKIHDYNLDKKFLPSDEEIKNNELFKAWDVMQKIQIIFKYDLPKRLLPTSYNKLRNKLLKTVKEQIKFLSDNYNLTLPISMVDNLKKTNVLLEYHDIHNNSIVNQIDKLYKDKITVNQFNYENMDYSSYWEYELKYEEVDYFGLSEINSAIAGYISKKKKGEDIEEKDHNDYGGYV